MRSSLITRLEPQLRSSASAAEPLSEKWDPKTALHTPGTVYQTEDGQAWKTDWMFLPDGSIGYYSRRLEGSHPDAPMILRPPEDQQEIRI